MRNDDAAEAPVRQVVLPGTTDELCVGVPPAVFCTTIANAVVASKTLLRLRASTWTTLTVSAAPTSVAAKLYRSRSPAVPDWT
jgi:hypothetical protein